MQKQHAHVYSIYLARYPELKRDHDTVVQLHQGPGARIILESLELENADARQSLDLDTVRSILQIM